MSSSPVKTKRLTTSRDIQQDKIERLFTLPKDAVLPEFRSREFNLFENKKRDLSHMTFDEQEKLMRRQERADKEQSEFLQLKRAQDREKLV